MINQPPDSDVRWQHESRICFATFIQWKVTKLLITQQPLKLEKKINTNFEALEFQKFLDVNLTKFENSQILLNKISHSILVSSDK